MKIYVLDELVKKDYNLRDASQVFIFLSRKKLTMTSPVSKELRQKEQPLPDSY